MAKGILGYSTTIRNDPNDINAGSVTVSAVDPRVTHKLKRAAPHPRIIKLIKDLRGELPEEAVIRVYGLDSGDEFQLSVLTPYSCFFGTADLQWTVSLVERGGDPRFYYITKKGRVLAFGKEASAQQLEEVLTRMVANKPEKFDYSDYDLEENLSAAA